MNIKFQRFSAIFEGKILPLENQFFDTPVLFLIFNRPDVTERVFGQIRKVQPKQLFIGADGPRADKPGEKEKCEATRQLVLDMIDWECEVKTLFRDENLGCGLAVSQAITWFFEHVEMGIILEDDCYPDLSFFPFCEELLEYYKDDERVMSITGLNWQDGKKRSNFSYYFSHYPGIWGWATWRKSWCKFIHRIDKQTDIIKTIKDTSSLKREFISHQRVLSIIAKVDSWDYSWRFTVMYNKAFCIIPEVNLVSNLGWGNNATHTHSESNWRSNRKTFSITFPLKHPDSIIRNTRADRYTARMIFLNRETTTRYYINKSKRIIKRCLGLY
jgi:hypothetical protein